MVFELELVDGDLLDQDVDYLVNAWNRNIIPWWLLIPQGVSGALKRRAGKGPFRELGYRPLPLGHARLTSAGRLPHAGIIHVAGINMLWRSSTRSIQASVGSALALAQQQGARSIAFPLLGAGSGGMPGADAERCMVQALNTASPPLRVVLVRYAKRVATDAAATETATLSARCQPTLRI